MSAQMLEQIACPNCGRSIDLARQTVAGKTVSCESCGGQFVLRGHICPYCGTYHEQEAQFCRQCGQSLARRCHQCSALNWIGDEYCAQCGAPLDIVDLVIRGHSIETRDRLDAQLEEIQLLKQEETAASNARLAQMVAEERARREALRQQQLIRQEQERKMIQVTLIAVGVILLALVLIAIF